MYYVHKFPNLSKVAIHLGTHSHLILKGMCRESFHEMKKMDVNKVYYTPNTTSLIIALFVNFYFFSPLVQQVWKRSYGAPQR
jgi:hypothetical protein